MKRGKVKKLKEGKTAGIGVITSIMLKCEGSVAVGQVMDIYLVWRPGETMEEWKKP